MFKLAVASAAAAVAVAQTPAQPRWPQEFTATITHSDNHNHTDVANTMFSVSNNAVQDSFTDPRGNKGLDLHDYQQRRDYLVIGTQCREQPERGSIQDRIPDLRRVTYNMTSTFQGQSVYVWNDSQGGRGPRGVEYLTTADANEYPVAFTDFNGGFADVYSNFVAVTTWPAGSFSKPAGCQ